MSQPNSKTLYAKEYRFIYETKLDKLRRKTLKYNAEIYLFFAAAIFAAGNFSPVFSAVVSVFLLLLLLLNLATYENRIPEYPVIGVYGKDKPYLFNLGTAVTAISDVPDPIDVARNRKKYEDKLLYPVLIDDKMPLTHMFTVGTTGAGKTTFEVNILKQILDAGAGTLAVDGKGDQTIYESFYNTCVDSGREDDFRVINFNNPKESNTFNPLLKGDADKVTDIIGNMLETGGDNAFWAGRALSFMKGLLSVLVPLRDMGLLFNPEMEREEILTFGVINKWIALQDLRTLYWVIKKSNDAGMLIVDCFSPEERKKYKPINLDRLKAYLASVYVDLSAEDTKFPDGAEKQHGNSYLMWNESLDMLAGRFGPIFDTENPTIDMEDVVSNGRIVYVLLPALQVDSRSLASLGKIVLSLLKNAIAVLLGDNISGTVEERYLSFAKRPRVPFFAMMDEYGSYAVEGFDNVLAQARSLRVAVVIMVQEIASLQKTSDIEKKRLLGNTGIKVALKLEEQDTIEEVIKMLGRRETATIRVRQEQQSFKEREIELQEKDVVEVKMLKEMVPGHGYITWAGDIVPFLVNYYDPPKAPEIPKFDYFTENVEPMYRMREIKKTVKDFLGESQVDLDSESEALAAAVASINSVFDTTMVTWNINMDDMSPDTVKLMEERMKEIMDTDSVREMVNRMEEKEKKLLDVIEAEILEEKEK